MPDGKLGPTDRDKAELVIGPAFGISKSKLRDFQAGGNKNKALSFKLMGAQTQMPIGSPLPGTNTKTYSWGQVGQSPGSINHRLRSGGNVWGVTYSEKH